MRTMLSQWREEGLPGRVVVERSFPWEARFRRLARDYERLPTTLAGLHFVAFA
jgi:transposase